LYFKKITEATEEVQKEGDEPPPGEDIPVSESGLDEAVSEGSYEKPVESLPESFEESIEESLDELFDEDTERPDEASGDYTPPVAEEYNPAVENPRQETFEEIDVKQDSFEVRDAVEEAKELFQEDILPDKNIDLVAQKRYNMKEIFSSIQRKIYKNMCAFDYQVPIGEY